MKPVAILLMSVLVVGTSLALAAEPVNVVGDGGPLLNWVIVGPFPVEVREDGRGATPLQGYDYDFLTALGGEAKVGLSEGTKVAYKDEKGAAKTAVAKAVTANDRGYVDFRKAFAVGGRDAYAYCVVQAPAETTVTCGMGINDYGKIWVNGALLSAERAGIATEPWSFSFPVPLRKGRNDILSRWRTSGDLPGSSSWNSIPRTRPCWLPGAAWLR